MSRSKLRSATLSCKQQWGDGNIRTIATPLPGGLLMPIKYILRDNKLTADPNDYRAIVTPTTSADLDAVVDRMLQRGTTVGRADILAVFDNLTEAVASMLLDGMRI